MAYFDCRATYYWLSVEKTLWELWKMRLTRLRGLCFVSAASAASATGAIWMGYKNKITPLRIPTLGHLFDEAFNWIGQRFPLLQQLLALNIFILNIHLIQLWQKCQKKVQSRVPFVSSKNNARFFIVKKKKSDSKTHELNFSRQPLCPERKYLSGLRGDA